MGYLGLHFSGDMCTRSPRRIEFQYEDGGADLEFIPFSMVLSRGKGGNSRVASLTLELKCKAKNRAQAWHPAPHVLLLRKEFLKEFH